MDQKSYSDYSAWNMPLRQRQRVLCRPVRIEFHGSVNGGMRRALVGEILDDHFLIFDRFVCLKEVTNLFQCVGIHILKILHGIPTRILARHRDDFVIALADIHHRHDTDRSCLHQNPGSERIGREKHHIQRITVIPERLRDEPVVERIVLRCLHRPIQLDQPRLLLDLIFILRSARNLNDHRDRFRHGIPRRDVMQQVHSFFILLLTPYPLFSLHYLLSLASCSLSACSAGGFSVSYLLFIVDRSLSFSSCSSSPFSCCSFCAPPAPTTSIFH